MASKTETPLNVEAADTSTHEYTRRISFVCDASASQLSNGKVVSIGNPSKVFTPTADTGMTPEMAEAWGKRDFSKAIVTEIKLRGVSSNCPEPVTIGMNLFDNGVNLVNKEGWLFSQPANDLSSDHMHTVGNYVNLTTVLPHERQRPNEVMYVPDMGKMKASQITKYGHLTMENLWDNIVAFPNEPYYYVDASHVICKIVSQNWDRLGIEPEHETVQEGRWVKLSADIVNQCMDQLQANVISKMPLTSLTNLGARFSANVSDGGEYKVVAEMSVKYKFP